MILIRYKMFSKMKNLLFYIGDKRNCFLRGWICGRVDKFQSFPGNIDKITMNIVLQEIKGSLKRDQ